MKDEDAFKESLERPETFWERAAEAIDWDKTWDCMLDTSNLPFVKWFPGAKLNTCFNAVDRHVLRGRGDQTALVYDSPVTNMVR